MTTVDSTTSAAAAATTAGPMSDVRSTRQLYIGSQLMWNIPAATANKTKGITFREHSAACLMRGVQ